MEDYKQLAHQKFLQKKKAEEEGEKKILEELRKRKEDEDKKILEELKKRKEDEDKKELYIQNQLFIISDTIDSYTDNTSDDDLLLLITNIYSSIENIKDIMSFYHKNKIIEQVINFTNKIDKLNKERPKHINTIKNVNILSEAFQKIYILLGVNVEIARNLSKPIHLRKAGESAFKRFTKNK
jgi:hypothetical protein